MFRIKLILCVVGGMMAYFGVQEFRVSSGSTVEPVDVVLADVEKGSIGDNNHWRIGEHIAAYSACVYEYEQSKYDKGEPGPQTTCKKVYYPVYSYEHDFIQKLAQLEEKYGSLDQAPDSEFPTGNSFKVLIKTKKFKKIGDIPDAWGDRESTQGLVINLIEGLDSEEEKLLKEGFPGLDTDGLMILEEGREPSSSAKSLGLIGGGACLALLGVFWLVRGDR